MRRYATYFFIALSAFGLGVLLVSRLLALSASGKVVDVIHLDKLSQVSKDSIQQMTNECDAEGNIGNVLGQLLSEYERIEKHPNSSRISRARPPGQTGTGEPKGLLLLRVSLSAR